MPARKTGDTLTRRWELLRLIPMNPPGKTPERLHRELDRLGFEVDKRTVYRDLLDLSRSFGIYADETVQPALWHWSWTTSPNLPGITLAEAVSLALVEPVLKGQLPTALLDSLAPQFELAHRKLQALHNENPKARWPAKFRAVSSHLGLKVPEIDPHILAVVQEALLNEQVLHLEYQGLKDSEARAREVHPRAMVQKGSVTYLVASIDPDDALRQFAMHRVRSARSLERRIRSLEFDLDAFIESEAHEPGDAGDIKLDAIVSLNLAKILVGTALADDQELSSGDGRVRLRATVRDNQSLRRWILGHGCAIEIIGPTGLREDIARHAREAASFYGNEPPRHVLSCGHEYSQDAST